MYLRPWQHVSFGARRALSAIDKFFSIASLIPLPPDANQYWTPESSDQQKEGIPKATTVHLPPFSTGSCDPWSQPPGFCVCSHATNVRASS